MAETTIKRIKTVFQLRRGNHDDWIRVNPILAKGEPAFELDTGKLKIGNGRDVYTVLDYIGKNVQTEISADGKSLYLSGDNIMSLVGFDEALVGQMLVKGNDSVEWIDYTEAIPLTDEDIEHICH